MKPIFSRGPSLQLRLFLAVIFAIVLIVVDSRLSIFSKVRSYLDTAVSPFFFVANGPRDILDGVSDSFTSREDLQKENELLRNELLLRNSDIQLLGQLRQENNRLRELLGSPLRGDEHKMITQVLSTESDPYSYQVVIDKGFQDGVYEGQPVINDKGVVGQVVAVARNTSRVLLICDTSHSLPIQVLRNDIRVIAVGTGCTEDLQLEYLPRDTDIRVGDVLVTSGLGGRFPEGYPVAVVSSVTIDDQRANTVIQAHPTVALQRLRYLLLLWPNDRDGLQPLPSEEVRRIAKERLRQMMPQVLPPETTPPVPPANSTPSSAVPGAATQPPTPLRQPTSAPGSSRQQPVATPANRGQ
ncbi:rod shape-determining protein MreC [Budviciaceae bacterium CWB-B4]|uniref:Cell shape-determining protein MreC n=1 Tax=Limnobaculum xujianqingii TaxID=2738837 RepID=A0A9D7FVE9_9GAMM|nr:rod shape-determining protein MreC [Limnobaculum xujianqingii]MBK5071462.1 rod shape-determining protein MreC [Limnobaculum xujianqingii]MBK5174771.1 rod shape-determining protein MreC [Limnobaculum xujianqingii]